MLFAWKDEYSVGIDEIDRQHRSLIHMINDLYEAMQDGSSGAVLTPILAALKDYTAAHFATEELCMREAGYPGLEQHRQEHAVMTAKIAELDAMHRSGKRAVSIQVLLFLRDWLASHICETDRRMAPCLKAGKPR